MKWNLEKIYFHGSPELAEELSDLLPHPFVSDPAQAEVAVVERVAGRCPELELPTLACGEAISCQHLVRLFLEPLDALEIVRTLGAPLPPTPESLILAVWQRGRNFVEQSLTIIAAHEKDREAARTHAHRLTGSLGTFGLTRAGQIAQRLEQALIEGNSQGIPEALAELRDCVERGPQATAPPASPYLLLSERPECWDAVASAWEGRYKLCFNLREARQTCHRYPPAVTLVDRHHPQLQAWRRYLRSQLGWAPRHRALEALPEQQFELLRQLEMEPPPTRRVVIVDDDPINCQALEGALSSPIVEVLCCHDPLEFWRHRRRFQPYDLILLDLDMPFLDGYELCRAIRYESDVPIFVVSARERDEWFARILNAGADDFISKPCSASELRRRVEARLRKG